MKEGLIFANARAKGKESNLLSKERLQRMMEAKTLSEGMRILLEVNYAGGFVPEKDDFYSILAEEERLVTAFVREAAPKGAGFECFFLRNDYHNIKVLYKGKYARLADLSAMIMPDGNYTFAYLKERFDQGKLDFSPQIAEACEKINRAFETGIGTPRFIDVTLDKALYAEINSLLTKNADKYIKQYFEAFIDSTNVASFVRTAKIGAGLSFFKEGFLAGGKISFKDLEECGNDKAKLSSLLSGSALGSFYEKIFDEDLASYETAQDDYLLNIFSANKTDMFSVAPILGYYLAKMTEIKVIRVILVCVKNNVSQEVMRKRVREVYA